MSFTVTVNIQDVLMIVSLILYLLTVVTFVIEEDIITYDRDLGAIETVVAVVNGLSIIGAITLQVMALCV